MTDSPIIFSGPMVRALLEGRKTQTRRLLNPQPDVLNGGHPLFDGFGKYSSEGKWRKLGYAPGDRLYVRESFVAEYYNDGSPAYMADYGPNVADVVPKPFFRPSIHMPRKFSRITLTVEAVKVERLQDISEEDALAEGVERDDGGHGLMAGYSFKLYDKPGYICFGAAESFKSLWQSLNAKRAPWDSNPWVVAVSFSVAKINIDALAEAA